MGHEKVLLCFLTALVLAGCGLSPFNSKPIVQRGPQPSQVVGKGRLPLCPQAQIFQAQALARNMARLRLGISKLQAVTVVGDPASAETFSLSNGAAVEVLFYHTPDTICRATANSGELMPLVFQDDRLLGYGPNYYKGFITPMMRPMAVPQPVNGAVGADNMGHGGGGAAMPMQRVEMMPTQSLAPAPAMGPRRLDEDLPTPPRMIRTSTPVTVGGNGYSEGMYTSAPNAIGRGEPLR